MSATYVLYSKHEILNFCSEVQCTSSLVANSSRGVDTQIHIRMKYAVLVGANKKSGSFKPPASTQIRKKPKSSE